MTLFKMALKNVRRNFYNYFLYFVSMVFSIMIYYIFMSIKYNDQVLDLANSWHRIRTAFATSSWVIAIFAGIFIWYSNSFFTRKRKQEVGLYSLMGVKKRQIGAMLFYENLLMGALALTVGISLGSVFSKIFIMLLVKLMGFVVNVKFVLAPQAILDTVRLFLIFFVLTSIHGYTIIYRFKLVDLFKAEQEGEKEPKASILKAVLGVGLIGGGYLYYLSAGILGLHTLLITLFLVVVGTYFFFSSFTLFLLKLLRRNKKKYYTGINMIGTSQLLYRIKRHARTLATIAILSATTLTAMGVTMSFYYDFQNQFEAQFPFSYDYRSPGPTFDQHLNQIIAQYPKNQLEQTVDLEFIRISGLLPRVVEGDYRKDDDLDTIHLLSASQFNQAMEVTQAMEPITLEGGQVAALDPFFAPAFMASYVGKEIVLYLGADQREKRLPVVAQRTRNLMNPFTVYSVVLVSDQMYQELASQGELVRLRGLRIKNPKQSKELTAALVNYVAEYKEAEGVKVRLTTYYTNYRDQLMTRGLTIFIGTFLGLIFLLSTGSIIFFKQLSEAGDDQRTYKILKNIGVNQQEMRGTIAKQMLFVFLLPLLVGMVHSWVALSLLDKYLNIELLMPIVTTGGAYTLIYMTYYFLTIRSYMKIVDAPM